MFSAAMQSEPHTLVSEIGDVLNEELDSASETGAESGPIQRPLYEDPFLVLAGYMFAHQKGGETPEIKVWAGDCRRLNNKIPGSYFNLPDLKNQVEFHRVHSHEAKMYFLSHHTHWGSYIYRRSKGFVEGTKVGFFKTLWKRIGQFLLGRTDPVWTKSEQTEFKFVLDPERIRDRGERAKRLFEVLKTADGMFLQRFISYPEEVWNWDKYDAYIVQAISILITDEFVDGQVSMKSIDTKTCYSQLKSARKTFKKVSHTENVSRVLEELEQEPSWIQKFYLKSWRAALRKNGTNHAYVVGVMSQTRGAGTPPPLVILQSKLKFLNTVSSVVTPMTPTERSLIMKSLDKVLLELPDASFTGLATKARVTITGAACWEATRKEGGTAQAVLDIMSQHDEFAIPIRDLQTGSITERRHKTDFDSAGEAVFWACLHEVMNTQPYELRKAFLTVVKEPGKGRSVTKGKTALKIVLDTVSKICSSPLRKGVESSKSGMGRSHHGWNFFLDMMSEDMKDELFTPESVEQEEYEDYVVKHILWEDVFLGSTDYQEATDQMHHEFAEIAGVKWMRKCGIPRLLEGIVRATCYKPRTIYFTGTGVLANIGDEENLLGTDVRSVVLRKGVLMGDPLTKVVLHLSNITARSLSEGLLTGEAIKGFVNYHEASAAFSNALTKA